MWLTSREFVLPTSDGYLIAVRLASHISIGNSILPTIPTEYNSYSVAVIRLIRKIRSSQVSIKIDQVFYSLYKTRFISTFTLCSSQVIMLIKGIEIKV